jgi:ATP-dependent Clp protease ATP-binding subunit ClpC
MFQRFTDRARRVLVLAQEEARDLASAFIGTEHLLLGLIREREGVAAEVMGTLGVTYELVREKVQESSETIAEPSSGSPPFTPRVKKVLEFSLRESLQLGHSYVGTEHLLLGLLREGNGEATRILDGLNIDMTRLRTLVIERISGQVGPDSEARNVLVEFETDSERFTSLVRKYGINLRPDLDLDVRNTYTTTIANELLDQLRQRWADAVAPPSPTSEP